MSPTPPEPAGQVNGDQSGIFRTLANPLRIHILEELRSGDMLEDELLAPGVISSTYVSGIARAERGAWPLGVADVYGIDDAHLTAYATAAKSREGFQRYLDEHVWQAKKNSLPA